LEYLRNIELFQICIDIFNDFEKGNFERKWYPLKNSFALLSVERSLKHIPNQVDPEMRYTYIANKDSTDYESYM
jgi:hypothetical protein